MADSWMLRLSLCSVLLAALTALAADGGSPNSGHMPHNDTAGRQGAAGVWGPTAAYGSPDEAQWDNVTSGNVSDEAGRNATVRVLCNGRLEELMLWQARFTLVCLPVIAVVGITGNLLSFVVMGAGVYRRKSYSYYLRALAIFDTLTIVTTTIVMGNDLSQHLGNGFFLRAHSVFTCKLTNFLSSVVFLMSSWLIVAFTVDRYIAVCHPLQLYRLCTAARARATIFLILVLVMASQAFRFYYIEKLDRNQPCHVSNKLRTQYFGVHFLWFSFVLRFTLPFIVIVVCNGLIIFHVRWIQRMRQPEVADKKKRAHLAITTLIAVCAVFVLTLVPEAVLSLVQFFRGRDEATFCLLIHIDAPLKMLRLVNYSVNFVLYGLTGRLFRSELKRLLMCKRQAAASSTTNRPLKVNFNHSMQWRLPVLGKSSGAPCRRLVGGRYLEKRLFLGRNNADYEESEL